MTGKQGKIRFFLSKAIKPKEGTSYPQSRFLGRATESKSRGKAKRLGSVLGKQPGQYQPTRSRKSLTSVETATVTQSPVLAPLSPSKQMIHLKVVKRKTGKQLTRLLNQTSQLSTPLPHRPAVPLQAPVRL